MNYYKQGDAAKADKIKAAWEKLGIKASGYDFSRKDVLFFTFEVKGKSYMMSAAMGTGLDNIILTHQDYKELELPVEPKFAIGQIICPTAESGLQPVNVEVVGVDVDKQRYTIKQKGYAAQTLPFKFQDKYTLMYIQSKPHYDIANFQPFDKVLVRDEKGGIWFASLFGNYHAESQYFDCVGGDYKQCIPFNDDTKHLLGTTDPCDEQYINW